MATHYLLDTNILVHSVRDNDFGRRLKERYDLLMTELRPYVCVVSDGELRSLAEQWAWNEARKTQAEFFLGYFVRVGIGTPDVLNAYARLDADSRKVGVRMGKNDLWIAAAAQVTGTTLLTTDADFDHLNGRFFAVERIDPEGA